MKNEENEEMKTAGNNQANIESNEKKTWRKII